MFTEILEGVATGRKPDDSLMRRWFDLALIKKLGVVKTPPSFWVADPKINPPGDQLFWIALLLADEGRLEAAVSILAIEFVEQRHEQETFQDYVRQLGEQLLGRLDRNALQQERLERIRTLLDGVVAEP